MQQKLFRSRHISNLFSLFSNLFSIIIVSCQKNIVISLAPAIFPSFYQFVILKMSDIEDDIDPIQAMHTHGAMPDNGNDALFAVANLGFGVEAHPEGMEADVIEQADQPPEPPKKRRRSHSLAHDAIKEEKLIFIHIDLETGGEAVGIIPMSAIAHDYTTNSRFGNSFNMYVKPPPHVKAKHWSSQAEAVTGLPHYCDKIKNAQSIVEVWKKFVEWCNNVVPDDKVGCLVAWNGKGSSDMKWIWVVSEELHPTTCKMPT
jgi:hypothetical protein